MICVYRGGRGGGSVERSAMKSFTSPHLYRTSGPSLIARIFGERRVVWSRTQRSETRSMTATSRAVRKSSSWWCGGPELASCSCPLFFDILELYRLSVCRRSSGEWEESFLRGTPPNMLILLWLIGADGAGQGASVEFCGLLQASCYFLQSVVQVLAAKRSPAAPDGAAALQASRPEGKGRIQIDQPPGARDRRVVRRVFVQRNAHETSQRKRIRQPPGNAALCPDALEISDQQRAKVNPRRQRGTSELRCIESCAQAFDCWIQSMPPPGTTICRHWIDCRARVSKVLSAPEACAKDSNFLKTTFAGTLLIIPR